MSNGCKTKDTKRLAEWHASEQTAVKRRKTSPKSSFDYDFSEIPEDMLIMIAKCGKWKMAGALARCSKGLLKRFCSVDVLIAIVNHFLKKPFPAVLPRWLKFSIPHRWVSEAPLWPRLLSIGNEAGAEGCFPLKHLLDHPPFTFPHFITGGYACQALYTRYEGIPVTEKLAWTRSDVDVWASCDHVLDRLHVHDYYPRPHVYEIDVIPTRPSDASVQERDPRRCIETFDLSLVQQGIHCVVSEGCTTSEEYCTPLSLYTFASHTVVANVGEYSIDYRTWKGHDRGYVYGTKDLVGVVIDHYATHVAKAMKYETGEWTMTTDPLYGSGHFFECPACIANYKPSRRVHDEHFYSKVTRWMERLRKYKNRFPKFRFVFFTNEETMSSRKVKNYCETVNGALVKM